MTAGVRFGVQQPRVFISHSSRQRTKDELRTADSISRHRHRKEFLADLLSLLEPNLTEAGFDVWIDRSQVNPGDPFDNKIHFALQDCDVGVILIDFDALDSNYVRKEATILMWRQSTGGTRVLPVLLPSVKELEFSRSALVKTIGLDSLSLLRPQTAKQNHAVAEWFAEEITGRLAGALPERISHPTARWIQDFTHVISTISVDRLWRVAERLGLDPQDWARTQNRHAAVACAMLGADMTHAYQALVQLVDLLDVDRARTKTVRWALPLWVDLDAAKIVVDVASLPADRRILAITTRALRLGEHVIQRATCSAPEYGTLRLPDVAGESPNVELLERYDATLRRLLHLSTSDTPDEIARNIDSLGGGVFALIRCDSLPPGDAHSLLKSLRKKFPGVVFVVLTERTSPVWEKLNVPDAYSALDEDEERNARRYVSRTAALIGEDITVDSND